MTKISLQVRMHVFTEVISTELVLALSVWLLKRALIEL